MKKGMNQIGLDVTKAKNVADELNLLLANYQLFYMNTRGFHWNIKGDNFFELHIKFEELYTNLEMKIDEVAERILTLGYTPTHTFTDYLKSAKIKEQKGITEGKKGVAYILESFSVIIGKQRDILELSEKANDEGTNSLMSTYISEQEKLVWMYTSYMGR